MQVLIARAGALGDLVLLRRTIAALVSAGHRVSLLAPVAPAAALVGPGEAREALAWDGPEMAALLAGETTGGPVEAALASADVVLALTRSAGALDALRRPARRLVARDPAPPPGGPHASLWLAGALEALGIDARDDPPPLAFTEAEFSDAEALTSGLQASATSRLQASATSRLPDRFLAVHPGSGSPAKNWSFERFVEAARQLSHGERWLLVLGPAEDNFVLGPAGEGSLIGHSEDGFLLRAAEDDYDMAEGVSAMGSLWNAVVARGLPLRRLAAVLSRAGLFLGNDSGVAHLAAACGTRTLALFGPTDPAQWAPIGPAVRTLRTSTRRMEDIGVGDVVAAGRRFVREPNRPG